MADTNILRNMEIHEEKISKLEAEISIIKESAPHLLKKELPREGPYKIDTDIQKTLENHRERISKLETEIPIIKATHGIKKEISTKAFYRVDTNIQKTLYNQEERIRKLEAQVLIIKESATQVPKKEISIEEFIRDKKPNHVYEIALAIAYYFLTSQRVNSFTADELADGFRQAKIPLPKEMKTIIRLNIKHGYMINSKEMKNNKKAFSLTNGGAKMVREGFPITNEK